MKHAVPASDTSLRDTGRPAPCGAVVSDLHLFTNRTTVHEHMTTIRRAAEQCSLFVFNGDIFDFQWSLHKGFMQSVRAAEEWIGDIVAAHPTTHFIFLLGNHDSIPAYREALQRLAAETDNVEWHPDWYRDGNRLFLHGDVYHGGHNREALAAYRTRCNRRLKHSRLHHACYWAFARSGLPAIFLRLVRRQVCARRITAYLAAELGPELRDIRHVYFGHVHTPFTDFRYHDRLFHNTGSATRGGRLTVMRFDLATGKHLTSTRGSHE